MIRQRLYSPDGGEGGGAPTGEGSAPTSPGSDTAPTSSPGSESATTSFLSALKEYAGSAPKQGGSVEEDIPSADKKTDTPEGELGGTEGGKEADVSWDKDEEEYLKEWGIELKPSKELKSVFGKYKEALQERENAFIRQASIEQMLLTGDLEGIQKAGFDLQVERRTPEDRHNEIVQQQNTFKEFADPLLDKLSKLYEEGAPFTKDHYDAIFSYFKTFSDGYGSKAEVIRKEIDRQSLASELRRELGIDSADKSKGAYSKLENSAKTHIAALQAEDPSALDNWKALVKSTNRGGALASMGITLAKLYGTSLGSAREANRLGKALRIAEDLPNILEGHKKTWEEQQAKLAANRVPPLGTSASPAQGVPGSNSQVSKLESLLTTLSKRS